MKGYKAIDIRTDGMKRELLVLRYLAMDVGIVTPVKDGMNLVRDFFENSKNYF